MEGGGSTSPQVPYRFLGFTVNHAGTQNLKNKDYGYFINLILICLFILEVSNFFNQ